MQNCFLLILKKVLPNFSNSLSLFVVCNANHHQSFEFPYTHNPYITNDTIKVAKEKKLDVDA